MYAMLDRTQDDQLTYYQPGIGTFAPPGVWGRVKRWFVTRLDLAIAWLLEEHVSDRYKFLMRYYRPGDRIYIFGFSRGAYTARVLAAMLHKVGLLTQGNEEMVPFAWNMFRRHSDPKLYTGFRYTFSRRVPVHFLGLWDTVSSVGWFWNPEYFQFTANNPSVAVVRHAIALDERRAYFIQNLWGNDQKLATDVLQIWFPGVHCDVGGGYRESQAGLSKIPLAWMTEEAEKFGVRFQPKSKAAILPDRDTSAYVAPDPTAMQHESLKGIWWIAEIIPKPYRDPAADFARRWIIHLGRHRTLAEGAKISPSVLERIKKVPSYRPPNLPTR
jgi:uncharacterized protein (DUF2235 family)